MVDEEMNNQNDFLDEKEAIGALELLYLAKRNLSMEMRHLRQQFRLDLSAKYRHYNGMKLSCYSNTSENHV